MNVMDSFSLKGKVALVTGASYGIGFAIACALSDAGATIVFNDIKQELVDKGLAAYAERGIAAHGYVCDVTDEAAVNAMVRVKKTYEPDAARHAVYEKQYRKFKLLFQSVQELYRMDAED